MHIDQRFINGLRDNDSKIISEIYKNYVRKVVSYIKNNGGDEDQAKDVVQEVLIGLFNQVKTKGVVLTCPFDAYFFLLCKRKWLNQLASSDKKKVTLLNDDVSTSEAVNQLVEETEVFDERKLIFDEALKKLGDKCKELLQLSFMTKSLDEVAQKLGVTYAYVRKKKSLCTGELTRMIQGHSQFQSIY